MVSAISTQSTQLSSISNVYLNISTKPIADEMKKVASIANSYYSLSDKVEAIKTQSKDDSSWLFKKVNELGVPAGLDIEGMDTTSQNIVVNMKSTDFSDLTSTPRVSMEDLTGESEEENDSMDLNGDGTITTDEMAQYMALQMAQAAEEVAQEVLATNSVNDKKSTMDKIENIVEEKEEENNSDNSSLLFSYKNGINSYNQNNKYYDSYLKQSASFYA